MIRWCCFCQRFLGESEPFDDPGFTHSICTPCDARLERGEPLLKDTEQARSLVNRVIAAANARDWASCKAAVEEARAIQVGADSLLLGLLQPVLYEAGRAWQAGTLSVAAEHQLTSWCERIFSSLPIIDIERPLDLLLLQAPGNAHLLGPQFAARLLANAGLSVEVVVPAIPFEEIVVLAQQLRPRAIGFSCALPESIQAANAVITKLRARLEPVLEVRYLLSGFAFRLGGGHALPSIDVGVEVVVDMEALALSLKGCPPDAHSTSEGNCPKTSAVPATAAKSHG